MTALRETGEGAGAPGQGSVCGIDRNARLLGQCPVFADLPRDMLRLLGYLARSCRFRAGDTVMRQGEVEGRAYLVVSGRLTAVRERRGRIVSTLALGQGSLFGGLTLLSGVPRLHTVTADTDTECLALDRAEARTVLARFPEPGLLVVDRIVAQVFERQECGFRRASDLDDLGDGGAREDRKAGD